ncbi:TetR/AcrR family transcriptional regulator [Microbacterium sp. JZ70]
MPAPKRVRIDAEERKRQILDAAIRTFGRQGYRQGALKDIAAEVGISLQGVLHHFGTKEALLAATLRHRNEIRAASFDTIRNEQGVVALFESFLTQNVAEPELMRLYVTLAAEATDEQHPAHAYFVERYAETWRMARSAVQTDQERGRVAPGDPDQRAHELIALSDGLQLQYLLGVPMDLVTTFRRAALALLT